MKSTLMTRFFVLALVLCFSWVTSAGAQRTPDLDTRFQPRAAESQTPEDRPVPVSVRGAFSPHQPPPPVSIRLLAVEPASCGWDQEVTYDIEIRNISQSVLTLPWTLIKPATSVGRRSRTEFSAMTVTLALSGPGPGRATLGGVETLYGDSSTQFTTRRVPPGASVVVRVPTKCVILNDSSNRSISVAGTPVNVLASVHLGSRDSEMMFGVTSNEIQITISRIDGR